MKMARSVPAATLRAAISHTRRLRGSRDTESGSMSPNTMISLPVGPSRMKNAEDSTVAQALSFPLLPLTLGSRVLVGE